MAGWRATSATPCIFVFADLEHRRLLVDWAELASASLGMFRADSARYAGDLDFARLVAG